MASEWYIARDGNRVGPYSSRQMRELAKSGQLLPADMLWKKGLAKWIPASTIKRLFKAAPLPVASIAPPAPAAQPSTETPAAPVPIAPIAPPAPVAQPSTATPVAPDPAAKPSTEPAVRDAAVSITESVQRAINKVRETVRAQPNNPSGPLWMQRKFLLAAGGGLGVLVLSCSMCCLFGLPRNQATTKQLRKFDLPKDLYFGSDSVHFLSDGKTALLSGRESLTLWDLSNGNKISSLRKQSTSRDWFGCDLSNDDRSVFAECQGKLTLFDVEAGTEKWRLGIDGTREGPWWFYFSRDGKTAFNLFLHTRVVMDGQLISEDGQNVGQPAPGLDAQKVQVVFSGCTVQDWDLRDRKRVRTFKGPSPGAWGASSSPDGHFAIFRFVEIPENPKTKNELVGSPLRLWDLKDEREILAFDGHTQGVSACVYSPDGRRILTGHKDGLLVLWDAQTAKEVRQNKGHADEVQCLAFVPDGRRALSGGKDKTIRLWDTDTSKEIQKFEGHKGAVQGLAVSPKGDRFLSLSTDNTMRLWQLPAFDGK